MTLEVAAFIGMGLIVLWGGVVLLFALKPWKKTKSHWDDAHHIL